ncbi:MAG: carbamoyl-phosphate synthase large subunit [Bacteroidota bacterium]|nr:carbamoyl-phosphate synthase large subunit [Candidatus Kapabacteria bacterium]MDW8220121.1 carbamoyl-phosphate synthase large subunit [Bacteroidota bacterium]
MPKRSDITSVLVIGSGPIIIGQACEFDYSGTQACKALREEGIRVALINSNPATIMTDPDIADATYIEPITPEYVEAVIAKERPSAILPTVGGQTALNVALEVHRRGILEKYGVQLIGSKPESIRMAEDREEFLAAMKRCGLEMPRGGFVTSMEEGVAEAKNIGRFPIIIRPSFTLGGTGGGIAYDWEDFKQKLSAALEASPIRRVLVEESIIGWKEYELEVMRDTNDNCVIICSIENFDPMGVHTGDSITVAPAQTLTDREYQHMRDAAIKIMREIGVETGGSNVQFAVNPVDGRLIVIEMNPRVSRSSALASKATGFPIAKIAAKLAIGYTLDEIRNDITKKTPACFEPTIDYVVVKVPRWDFEKFKGVDDELTVQMKSVGEAMAFGRTFKEALQKALRSIEKNRYGFGYDNPSYLEPISTFRVDKEVHLKRLFRRKSDSIFDLCDALRMGMSTEEIHAATHYDPWFIEQCRQIVQEAEALLAEYRAFQASQKNSGSFAGQHMSVNGSTQGARNHQQSKRFLETLSTERLFRLKQYGFSDYQLAMLTGVSEMDVRAYRVQRGIIPVFKTVDTCAAEFESETPYHYSTYEQENESVRSERKKVVILGSGPNRIGQGIEFDYCCVQAVFALKQAGYEAIMINCNPETVSTDYDITDKLYFEPLTLEDVLNVLEHERPDGVIVTFGGQTPLKLAHAISAAGFKIIGTSPEGIDIAEDRKRFGALLDELRIPCPKYGTATTVEEALEIAHTIGYPVLVRPSYVLGGRSMQICYHDDSLRRYMSRAINVSPERPILIDEFLENAYEFDVDAVADGEHVVIGAVMQHIEEAGVHSGDSSCVLPPYNITQEQFERIVEYTRQLAQALHVVGLMNIQLALQEDELYVLEVNPRASRTVPFVSKARGIALAQIATHLMLGKKLRDDGIPAIEDFSLSASRVAIKESVFPFNKFPKADIYLGPEMRSTGEVMGIDRDFARAIIKANIAAGMNIPERGRVFASLCDRDKTLRAAHIIKGYYELGFEILATAGTAEWLKQHGVPASVLLKYYEGSPNVIDYIEQGSIHLVINTPKGENSRVDEQVMGRAAMKFKVPFITTLAAAQASLKGLQNARIADALTVRSLQEYYAE